MAFDTKMHVLIVDDYKTMLRIIRNLLKQIDFENVDEASDGGEAFAKMQAGNFGLVISDWNMEPMTGLQLLQHVRGDAKLKANPPKIRIVVRIPVTAGIATGASRFSRRTINRLQAFSASGSL